MEKIVQQPGHLLKEQQIGSLHEVFMDGVKVNWM